MASYAVVVVFADPGGLAVSVLSRRERSGLPSYRVALSIEKNMVVHQRFRRQASRKRVASEFPEIDHRFIKEGGVEPDRAMQFPAQWAAIGEQDLRRVA